MAMAKMMTKTKKTLLLLGSTFVLCAAAPASDADLSVMEATTVLLNHESLLHGARLKYQMNNAFLQPPTWMATVANVQPLGTILDANSNTRAFVKQLLNRVAMPGSTQQVMMTKFQSAEDKFTAYNPALLLANDLIPNTKSEAINDLVTNLTYPFPDYIRETTSLDTVFQNIDEIIKKGQLSIPQTYFSNQKEQRLVQDKQTISYMSALKEESTRRFLDKDSTWYSGTAVSSPEAILRDLNHMKAVHLALQYERLRQMENQEIMIAGSVYPETHSVNFYKKLAVAVGAANTTMKTISDRADQKAKENDEEMQKEQEKADKKAGKASKPKDDKSDKEDLNIDKIEVKAP